MKKQYIFLIMLAIILYMGYLIISFSYKEYKISSHIEYIQELNSDIKEKIEIAKSLIGYKSSDAYINKVLKQEQSFKNKGEKAIYLTNEETYNKYVKNINETNEEKEIKEEKNENNLNMTIFQKWIYIIFKKDLSI